MNIITQAKEKVSDLSPTSDLPKSLPDNTQIPHKDNNFVENFPELPEQERQRPDPLAEQLKVLGIEPEL